jgi:hypothetical protein
VFRVRLELDLCTSSVSMSFQRGSLIYLLSNEPAVWSVDGFMYKLCRRLGFAVIPLKNCVGVNSVS